MSLTHTICSQQRATGVIPHRKWTLRSADNHPGVSQPLVRFPPASAVQDETNTGGSSADRQSHDVQRAGRAARCCPLADCLTVTAICLKAAPEARRPASAQTFSFRSRWAGGEPSRAAHTGSSASLAAAQKLCLPTGLCSPLPAPPHPPPPRTGQSHLHGNTCSTRLPQLAGSIPTEQQ